jgi:hypothetical protein
LGRASRQRNDRLAIPTRTHEVRAYVCTVPEHTSIMCTRPAAAHGCTVAFVVAPRPCRAHESGRIRQKHMLPAVHGHCTRNAVVRVTLPKLRCYLECTAIVPATLLYVRRNTIEQATLTKVRCYLACKFAARQPPSKKPVTTDCHHPCPTFYHTNADFWS